MIYRQHRAAPRNIKQYLRDILAVEEVVYGSAICELKEHVCIALTAGVLDPSCCMSGFRRLQFAINFDVILKSTMGVLISS
jgi:hypothetical protein